MKKLIPYLLLVALLVWGFNIIMRGHGAVKQSYDYAKNAQTKLISVERR